MAGERAPLVDDSPAGPFCGYVAAFQTSLARARDSRPRRWFTILLFHLGPGLVFAAPLWMLFRLSPGAYLLAASVLGVLFMQLSRAVCTRRLERRADG